MSGLYSRVKGAIQKKIYSRHQNYYDPEYYPEEDEVDYPEQLDENKSNNAGDPQRVKNASPTQQTPTQGQTEGRAPINQTLPPSPLVNPPNPEIRTVPNIIQPNLPLNTNINPPINANTVPIPTPPAPTNSPINPNQEVLPNTHQVPQPSTPVAALPSIKNRKRRSFMINPSSQLVGFPRARNFQPAWPNKYGFGPRQQIHPPPHPRRANISNLGIDDPIENVFIDRHIPPSMAAKINETVEHDRFNNTHFTHRYAYKPKTQHIPIGNNQHLECRVVDDVPQMGVRYIREISYPQTQNINNVQLIIDTSPQLNCFPVPIHHYTAHALPNDPMQNYY